MRSQIDVEFDIYMKICNIVFSFRRVFSDNSQPKGIASTLPRLTVSLLVVKQSENLWKISSTSRSVFLQTSQKVFITIHMPQKPSLSSEVNLFFEKRERTVFWSKSESCSSQTVMHSVIRNGGLCSLSVSREKWIPVTNFQSEICDVNEV